MHSFSAGENSPPLGDILLLKITVEFKPMLVNLKKKAQSVIMIECSKAYIGITIQKALRVGPETWCFRSEAISYIFQYPNAQAAKKIVKIKS